MKNMIRLVFGLVFLLLSSYSAIINAQPVDPSSKKKFSSDFFTDKDGPFVQVNIISPQQTYPKIDYSTVDYTLNDLKSTCSQAILAVSCKKWSKPGVSGPFLSSGFVVYPKSINSEKICLFEMDTCKDEKLLKEQTCEDTSGINAPLYVDCSFVGKVDKVGKVGICSYGKCKTRSLILPRHATSTACAEENPKDKYPDSSVFGTPGDWHISICKGAKSLKHIACIDGQEVNDSVPCDGNCSGGKCNNEIGPYCFVTNTQKDPMQPRKAVSGIGDITSDSSVSSCTGLSYSTYEIQKQIFMPTCSDSSPGTINGKGKWDEVPCPSDTVCFSQQGGARCDEIKFCNEANKSSDPTKIGSITVISSDDVEKTFKNGCSTTTNKAFLYSCDGGFPTYTSELCPVGTQCCINYKSGDNVCAISCEEEPEKSFSCEEVSDSDDKVEIPGEIIVTNNQMSWSDTVEDKCKSYNQIIQYSCLKAEADKTVDLYEETTTQCPDNFPYCKDTNTGPAVCTSIEGCVAGKGIISLQESLFLTQSGDSYADYCLDNQLYQAICAEKNGEPVAAFPGDPLNPNTPIDCIAEGYECCKGGKCANGQGCL